MSLFSSQEITARVYGHSDSDSTKITGVDFVEDDYDSITINILRRGDMDSIIEGEILGEYRANVDQSGITRGDVIWVSSTEQYLVSKKPRYNKLFNKYHLNLKVVKETP